MELYKLIKQHSPDVVILTETRSLAGSTMKKIWPGCKVEEIPPFRCGMTGTPRSGVAVGVREGIKCSLEKKVELVEKDGKDLAQVVRVRISETIAVVGLYVSPGMNHKKMSQVIEQTHSIRNPETLVAGDFNARHLAWDKTSNSKGNALMRIAKKYNMTIK